MARKHPERFKSLSILRADANRIARLAKRFGMTRYAVIRKLLERGDRDGGEIIGDNFPKR